MSERTSERLYQLLPAVYRLRDSDRGEPLRALLRVIGRETQLIEDDIARLYDNWFIETCDEWVVPYIADLVGVRPIRAVPSAAVSTRAYVANTLAYRRRKGTALVLEQLARDTTGWPAHAVEFFQLLATAQNLNHVRATPTGTPSVRDAAHAELAGTAFDTFAHVPQMRNIETRGGRYNVPNLGLFLWRLQSYPLGQRSASLDATDFATARRLGSAGANVFSFHPTGIDAPLFAPAERESAITHLAEEHNVPGPLRELAVHRELEIHRQLAAGTGLVEAQDLEALLHFMPAESPAFRVFAQLDGASGPVEVPPAQIYLCELPAGASGSPPALAVAVDLKRGRLRFADSLNIVRVLTCFNYGFPADLGGGPYERAASVAAASTVIAGGDGGFSTPDWQAAVSHLGDAGTPQTSVFPDFASAIAAWNALPAGLTGVIAILDSLTDDSGAGASPVSPIEIQVAARSQLLIVGATWPKDEDGRRHPGTFNPTGVRPHLRADLVVNGVAPPDSADTGALFVNGLLVEGALRAEGHLGLLQLQHCTLMPEHGGLQVLPGNDRLSVSIDRCIVGGVDLQVPIAALQIRDSIVQAGGASAAAAVAAAETPCSFDSCTVIGSVVAQSLSATSCLFADVVTAIRHQTGCVRFSYLAPFSTTPRRYQCQPDDSANAALIKPLFVSLRYGDPTYCQLERRCPEPIRTGAEDGSEMGVYRFLQQPFREGNLRTVLNEYLPFAMQAGAFFVT